MNASTETDNIVDKDKKGGIWVVEKAKKWKLRRKTTTIKKIVLVYMVYFVTVSSSLVFLGGENEKQLQVEENFPWNPLRFGDP